MELSRWSFEARQELCQRISRLPPPCLSDVVHIIFGHTTAIVTGDEFTVDFAKLDDRVCVQLEAYLSNDQDVEAALAKGGPERAAEEEAKASSGEQEAERSSTAESRDEGSTRKRRRKERNAKLVKEIRGPLAYCRVRDAAGARYSVLASRGKFQLLLSDAALSLEWTQASEMEPAEVEDASFDDRATARDCASALAWLGQLDVIEPFARPVDARSAQAYRAIVDDPIDLEAIEGKLRRGEYAASRGAGFAADVRRVHRNVVDYCELADAADAAVYRAAQVFIAAFQGRWRERLESKPVATSSFEAADVAPWLPDRAPSRALASVEDSRRPEDLVGMRVEIFWHRDNRWYAAVVDEFRRKDGRARVEYDDGQTEWMDVSKERYRVLGPAAASAGALISVQKLGILVWAKSNAHPWWPAELCLPAADRFVESLPPPKSHKPSPKKHFVFYFGETQYDILDVANVVPLDARPKPTKRDNKQLLHAYDLAQARKAALDQDPGQPAPEAH